MPHTGGAVSAEDLMIKLQLSRAAQAAAAQTLAASRPSTSPWLSSFGQRAAAAAPQQQQQQRGAAPPHLDIDGGGAPQAAPAAPKQQQPAPPPAAAPPDKPTGFNSFMAEGLLGWKQELMSLRLRQAVAAEFLATGLFVAGGLLFIMASDTSMGGEGFLVPDMTGSGRFAEQAPYLGFADVVLEGQELNGDVTAVGLQYNNPVPRFMGISLAFGFLICCLVFSTGAISGGNLNPAVTVALFLQGKMSGLRMMLYVVAQCAGAIAGAYYAYSLSPQLFVAVRGGVNDLAPEVLADWGGSWWTAVGAEICGTALLVFTVSAAADVGRERANKYVGALTPLMIGFAVLVCHVALIPIDGCSINPARSLASAVVMNKWENHYIFWLGPLLGGPLAAILYDRVFYTGVSDTSVQVRPLDNLAVVLARLQASAAERWEAGGGGSPRGAKDSGAAAAADAGRSSQQQQQQQQQQQAPQPAASAPAAQTRRVSRAGSLSLMASSTAATALPGFGLPLILPTPAPASDAAPDAAAAAAPGFALPSVAELPASLDSPATDPAAGLLSGALTQRQMQRRIKCVRQPPGGAVRAQGERRSGPPSHTHPSCTLTPTPAPPLLLCAAAPLPAPLVTLQTAAGERKVVEQSREHARTDTQRP